MEEEFEEDDLPQEDEDLPEEDDDGYIDPAQRARRTVGSVGGGGALGKGARSPVLGPRGADRPALNKLGSNRSTGKKVPDKDDSNRYKGIRGFLRKLFE